MAIVVLGNMARNPLDRFSVLQGDGKTPASGTAFSEGVTGLEAYATLGNQCLSLQVGHFYSVVGYEGVMAPDNFFYSKSYSYQFAGPFTHWGGMLNWQVSEPLNLQLGVHNGSDGFDRTSYRPGVIAKAKYEFCKNFWTSFAITSGDETNNLAGLALVPDYTNRTRYSFLVNVPVTHRVEYVFHHWLGFQADGAPNGDDTDWYGIDQYLYVTLNNCWKAGARFEWFHDEDGTRVGLRQMDMNDHADKQRSEADAELEREIRRERKLARLFARVWATRFPPASAWACMARWRESGLPRFWLPWCSRSGIFRGWKHCWPVGPGCHSAPAWVSWWACSRDGADARRRRLG